MRATNESDETLLELWGKESSQAAFAELHKRYERAGIAYVRKVAYAMNQEFAEDLVQDAFLEVYGSWEQVGIFKKSFFVTLSRNLFRQLKRESRYEHGTIPELAVSEEIELDEPDVAIRQHRWGENFPDLMSNSKTRCK